MEESKLKELYDLLLQGKVIQGIDEHGRGAGIIRYKEDKYKEPYFYWQHYGSSANNATMDGLKFICERIFDDCIDFCTCHWSDYHINYVPDDERYKGIDMSREHPNTYGK